MSPSARVPDFPSLIRQLIKATSVESVAERLGCSARTVGYWATGDFLPPLTRAAEIATRLKRDPSYIRTSILNAQRKRGDGRRG